MSNKLDLKDIWVRKFEITDPRRHKKGFTVYKVISTVFPRSFPDGATRIIVWKRYKEFKGLHKELEALFHQLYLKGGKFPPLPKDKFFGRFDDDVIEDRRKAALELLEFSATYPQLFMNKVFVKFFEDGHYPRDFMDESGIQGEDGNLNVKVEEENTNFKDCLVPEKVWIEPEVRPEEEDQMDSSPSFSSPEESPVKTHPPLPLDDDQCDERDDNLLPVNNESSIVVTTGVENEQPNTSTNSHNTLPKPHVVTFSDTSASHCNNSNNNQSTNGNENITIPFKKSIISSTTTTVPAPYSLQDTKNLPFMGSSASLNDDVMDNLEEEFDFCRNESHHLPNSVSTLSLNTCSTRKSSSQQAASTNSSNSVMKRNFKKYTGFNLFDFLPIFTKKQDKVTEEQNLSHSLSSYIREAAGFISVARRHESNGDYAEALASYTEGIKILLEGARGDEDNSRRALVKRKVEKYLSHAEDLKQKVKGDAQELRVPYPGDDACCGSNESHHSEDSFVVLTSNVMPSSIEELKNYKVVGSTYNNILVAVDLVAHGGPNCFAIKVLRKSSSLLDPEKPSLIPNSIPFMVQLLKWFNTDDAVVLILQYAAGGRLLNFVQSYQTKEMSIPRDSSSELISATKQESLAISSNDNDIERAPIVMKEKIPPLNFFDNSTLVTEDIVYKLENLGVNGEGGVENGGVDLCSVEPSKAANSIGDLQTDALIENSRALLNTVSKTLETQKKSTTSGLDKISPLPTFIDLDSTTPIEEEQQSSTNPVFELKTTNDSVREPSPFMGFNSTSPPEMNESQINGEATLPTRTIPERCIKIWAAELVIALDKLHSQGITYGDLDINNILLGENGHILLTYRALWNEVDSKSEYNDFSAPEVANYALGKSLWKSHPSSDWWSLGAILYFLLVGLKLQHVHPEGLHPQTVICVPPCNLLGEFISPEARTFLVELLHYNPSLRLGYYGAEEIKSHPFFAEFDWVAAESSTLAGDCK